jgi:RimJ/RimL family protein N-acetyltransferase
MVPVAIETDRLVLERWGPQHSELLVGLSSIAQVTTFIGPGEPWSRETAEEVALSACRHWADHNFGWRAAVERSSGELVGFLGLNFAGAGTAGLDASEYEIGWWLDPTVWGRGFAREGAAAIRDEALTTVRAPSVIARIQPTNARSIAVAESAGLAFDFATTGRSGEAVAVYRLRAPRGQICRRASRVISDTEVSPLRPIVRSNSATMLATTSRAPSHPASASP